MHLGQTLVKFNYFILAQDLISHLFGDFIMNELGPGFLGLYVLPVLFVVLFNLLLDFLAHGLNRTFRYSIINIYVEIVCLFVSGQTVLPFLNFPIGRGALVAYPRAYFPCLLIVLFSIVR